MRKPLPAARTTRGDGHLIAAGSDRWYVAGKSPFAKFAQGPFTRARKCGVIPGSGTTDGETARLHALDDLAILDSVPEERFDRLTRQLAERLGVPIAYLSLIADRRQWLKSRIGEVPQECERQHALCNQTIREPKPLVVEDASRDPRFAASPLVAQHPGIRFYAGVPISAGGDRRVGTVCIAGLRPRRLSARELAILQGFARKVGEELTATRTLLVAYAGEDADSVLPMFRLARGLIRQGVVDLWSSQALAAESDQEWRFRDAIERARVAVLLVSPQFLESEYALSGSVQRLFERRMGEGLELALAVLEPCDWRQHPLLGRLEPWNDDGEPLAVADQERGDSRYAALLERAQQALTRRAGRRLVAVTGEAAAAATAAAQRPLVFLSHAGEDAQAVRELAGLLRQADLEVWLDLEQLTAGDRWMEALEEALGRADAFAVYVGRAGIARWIGREVRVALDRSVNDPSFKVIPILGPGSEPDDLPPFLAQHQWLDLRGESRLDAGEIRRLVGAILERPAEKVSLLPKGQAPFRGLFAFDVEHAHLFFGRDRETEELVAQLAERPLLAVVGESGSGKSSLVRAGLVPALHRGRLPDSAADGQRWRVAILRPGREPFRELASALVGLAEEDDAARRLELRRSIAEQLASASGGVGECLGALVPAGEAVLLVVDQFEELFTQSEAGPERQRFITTLLAAADVSGDRPTRVVLTLREDFLSHCFHHPELYAAITGNQYAVRRMGRKGLLECIRKPVELAGARLEPGLAEAIVEDLGDEPGALALLEHTLLELWQRRRREQLSHDAYNEIGRVQGALQHHADDVLARLDPAGQKLARRVLLALVTTRRGDHPTRRRARWDEVVPAGADAEATEKVILHLSEQRLITSGRSGDEGAPKELEIAHEALIRSWRKLGEWLDADREFLLWRQRTRPAFERWQEAGQEAGFLLSGAAAVEARRWAERRGELGEAGARFVTASVQRERRRRLLRQAAVAAIAVLGLLAAGFGVYAVSKRQQAEDALGVAERAVDDLTFVGSEALAEVPGLEDTRSGLLERARSFYTELQEQSPSAERLRVAAAAAPARVAEIDRALGRGEQAEQLYGEALAQLERLVAHFPSARRELARVRFRRGEARRLSGDTQGAADDLEVAIGIQNRLIEESGPGSRLSERESAQLRFELGAMLNERGVLTKTRARLESEPDPAEAERRFKEEEGDYLLALGLFEQALELAPDLDVARQGLAWAHNNLGEFYVRWAAEVREAAPSRRAQAREQYQRAIELLEELLGTSWRREYQLELAEYYNNLGNLLVDLGEHQRAIEVNRAARDHLRELERPLADVRNAVANTANSRGTILQEGLKEYGAARESYAESVAIYREIASEYDERGDSLPADYSRRLGKALYNLAWTEEDPAGVLRLLAEAAEQLERGEDLANAAGTLAKLAEAAGVLGDNASRRRAERELCRLAPRLDTRQLQELAPACS